MGTTKVPNMRVYINWLDGDIWDVEAAGSSPVTRTMTAKFTHARRDSKNRHCTHAVYNNMGLYTDVAKR